MRRRLGHQDLLCRIVFLPSHPRLSRLSLGLLGFISSSPSRSIPRLYSWPRLRLPHRTRRTALRKSHRHASPSSFIACIPGLTIPPPNAPLPPFHDSTSFSFFTPFHAPFVRIFHCLHTPFISPRRSWRRFALSTGKRPPFHIQPRPRSSFAFPPFFARALPDYLLFPTPSTPAITSVSTRHRRGGEEGGRARVVPSCAGSPFLLSALLLLVLMCRRRFPLSTTLRPALSSTRKRRWRRRRRRTTLTLLLLPISIDVNSAFPVALHCMPFSFRGQRSRRVGSKRRALGNPALRVPREERPRLASRRPFRVAPTLARRALRSSVQCSREVSEGDAWVKQSCQSGKEGRGTRDEDGADLLAWRKCQRCLCCGVCARGGSGNLGTVTSQRGLPEVASRVRRPKLALVQLFGASLSLSRPRSLLRPPSSFPSAKEHSHTPANTHQQTMAVGVVRPVFHGLGEGGTGASSRSISRTQRSRAAY